MSRIYPLLLPSSKFCINIWVNLDFYFFQLEVSTGNFRDIAHSHRFLASQYMRYDNCVLRSWSIVYFLLAFAFQFMAWNFLLMMFFSTISNISTFFNNPSSTSVSLHLSATVVLVLEGNEQDLVYKFQGISFWNSQNVYKQQSIKLYM